MHTGEVSAPRCTMCAGCAADGRTDMSRTVTVSSRGWVVIPAEYRAKYGLRAGDRVRIVDYGGVLSIVPVPPDAVAHGKGLLKGGSSLVRALRRERRKSRTRKR